MATFLYKLGRFAFRRRHYIALFWAALLAAACVAAFNAPTAGSWSYAIPGIESQKAYDLLAQRSPGSSADGGSANVVFKAPAGEKMTDADNKDLVEQTVKDLGTGPEVESVTDPFTQHNAVSKDGTIAYAQVKYTAPAKELKDSTKDFLEKTVEESRHSGVTVEIGGDVLDESPETGIGEVIGVAVAAVVLVVTLGSLVAAGLPLLTALIGVGIGVAGITALANALDLGDTTSILAMMIGLAVGIDYALFILSRYRGELAEGREREDAVGRATGTAGSAVVFAGLTVVIALVGLSVVDVPVLTKMGMAAAGTVVLAVLIALTMVPAMIGYVGRKIQPAGSKSKWFGGRKARANTEGKPNMGTRWGSFVVHAARRRSGAGRGRPGGDGRPGDPAATRPGRRQHEAGVHDAAKGLRPPLGRLRPRLQRPADGRCRHQGEQRPEGGRHHGDRRDQGPEGRCDGHSGVVQQGR